MATHEDRERARERYRRWRENIKPDGEVALKLKRMREAIANGEDLKALKARGEI